MSCPVMDGWWVVQTIRKTPGLSAVKLTVDIAPRLTSNSTSYPSMKAVCSPPFTPRISSVTSLTLDDREVARHPSVGLDFPVAFLIRLFKSVAPTPWQGLRGEGLVIDIGGALRLDGG